MRISEQVPAPSVGGATETARPVLTRSLLVRASKVRRGEAQALRFRALYLNLRLVIEIANRLGLTDAQRTRTENAALDGLHEAVMRFDPYGAADFTDFATPFVESQIHAHVATTAARPVRNPGPALVRKVSRLTARPARR